MTSCEPHPRNQLAGDVLGGTWKVFKECGVSGVGGNSPGKCTLHDSATTICSKTLITYITLTVQASDIQNCTAIVSKRHGL
jgi:hypothetical protein